MGDWMAIFKHPLNRAVEDALILLGLSPMDAIRNPNCLPVAMDISSQWWSIPGDQRLETATISLVSEALFDETAATLLLKMMGVTPEDIERKAESLQNEMPSMDALNELGLFLLDDLASGLRDAYKR